MATESCIVGVAITSVASALPDKIVTNADFAKTLDTSDQWITERTGIKERRFGESTSALSIRAGRMAIERAGLQPSDIDFVILATSTPDRAMPPTSAAVQEALGTSGGITDINVACSGFVYALQFASGLILGGMQHILVIGTDTISKIIDMNDRTTAVLFGDGGGAAVVSTTNGPSHLLASDFGADGTTQEILSCENGGYITMTGKEVYRQAVLHCVESIMTTLQTANLTPSDIDMFVPHQANVRIMAAISERIGWPMEKCHVVVDKTGNTSAASIPLALDDAVASGRLTPGMTILLCGFGAGMAWGTQIWKWGTP